MSDDAMETLRRALRREQAARAQAEGLLAERSAQLHKANQQLASTVAARLEAAERRETLLFEGSPVALFVNDFSALAPFVKAFRESGSTDAHTWAQAHLKDLITANLATGIVQMNRAARTLLNVETVEVFRENLHWFFKQEYFFSYLEFFEAVANGASEFKCRTRIYALGRRALDVILFARPAVGSERKLDRILCSVIDVTEQTRIERDLDAAKAKAERAAGARTEILGWVGHEIRTPLTAVLGLAQVLEADNLTPTQAEHVALIKRGGKQLLSVVNDTLDLAKVEAGQLTLEDEHIDLARYVGGFEKAWGPAVREKGLDFKVEADFPWPAARFDGRRCRQILDNLMANALRYTEVGGVAVTWRAEKDGTRDVLRVSVRDTGGGIKPDELERLWDRFAQGAAQPTEGYRGVGLGLSIVKQLTRLMGGDATAQSTLGEGACFSVVIAAPRTEAAEPEADPKPLAAIDDPEAGSVARVLVAEDSFLNQRVIAAMLDALNVDCRMVSDGEAAVDAASGEDFDMILMDVGLPRLDGVGAAAKIRALPGPRGRTPIVAVTASVLPEDRRRFLAAGMNDIVPKPIDGAALARVITQFARERRALAQVA